MDRTFARQRELPDTRHPVEVLSELVAKKIGATRKDCGRLMPGGALPTKEAIQAGIRCGQASARKGEPLQEPRRAKSTAKRPGADVLDLVELIACLSAV